jgi:uncharacterized membrane protein
VQFASSIPLWLAVLIAVACAGLGLFAYRRPLVPLSRAQRIILGSLRSLALAALVFFLCRPVVLMPPAVSSGVIVPILVDVSRSMRIADADGQTRLARAVAIVEKELAPALSPRFTPEIHAVGEGIVPASLPALAPDARRSDLSGALTAVAERYRGRRTTGIVLISDGADTTGGEPDAEGLAGPPVFTIGVGSAQGLPDREILGIVAGDPRLDQSSVDLHVTAATTGFGRAPFQLRVLGNGRLIESRSVVPAADRSPIDEVFTVSPDPLTPTVYSAEIAQNAGEAIVENNSRTVLVNPAGRKRRILALEGGPGFEHSFLTRALSIDPGLELDSVVRKGKNERGEETFLVQAGAGRAPALTSGFPATREALFFYDAVLIANIEGDVFTRNQLSQVADFVSLRGGGLMVLGGRSFAQRGLIGSPLEDVLPVELNDRRGLRGAVRMAPASASRNSVAVTTEGETHPITRLGATPEETRKLWAALPALAASAPLGGAKPGATVLAVTSAAGGALLPVVAVQRYGRGRSMIFAGEASWRWRMMRPATDRSFEYFWRSASRWLGGSASDPVAVDVPAAAEPGDSIAITVDARDKAFAPVPDAAVDATLTLPGGQTRPLTLRHEAGSSGRFSAALGPDQVGLYRVRAEARRASTSLGSADRWFYVGGGDREFAEPRLNEAFLRRVARASGGQYVPAADAAKVVSWLSDTLPRTEPPERRDLWHRPSVFALMIALLSAEWILRRRWGLR